MAALDKIGCVIENKILKGPEVPFSPGKTNIGETLLNALNKNPGFVGLIDAKTGRSSTYQKISEESRKCALWLRKNKITSGDIISIFSDDSLVSLAPFLAIWYVGATASPCPPNWDSDIIRSYLNLVKPKIVFADEGKVDIFIGILKEEKLNSKLIVLGNFPKLESFDEIIRQQLCEEVENFQCSTVKPDDIALFSLSSGSTGVPKCIKQTYEGQLYKNFSLINEFHGNKKNMVICIYSSLATEFTVRYMNVSILTSSVAVVTNPASVGGIFQIIEKYRVQHLFSVATPMEKLIDSRKFAEYDLSSLQRLILGGANMNKKIVETFNREVPNCEVFDCYGLNEIGGVTIKKYLQNECKFFGLRINVQIKFIDVKTGEKLGPNKPGEMYVKAPYMMKGYFKNPEATAKAIDSEGWFHTGDFAYYDERGIIHFIERISMMIKYKNHLIIPSEIQKVIASHPGVTDVAVVGVPHPLDGEHPIACVVRAKDSKVSAEEIVQLSASLGEDKILRGGVIFVKEIPYLLIGKIDRQTILKMIQKNTI